MNAPQPKVPDALENISMKVDITGEKETALPILEECVPPHQIGFSTRVGVDVVAQSEKSEKLPEEYSTQWDNSTCVG